jgi:hypothetical protein
LTGKLARVIERSKTASKINLLQKCQKSWIGGVDCFGV